MFEDFEGILKNSTKMSPGGHPYKKGRGVLIRTFWGFSKSGFGASKSVQPQEVHTGAFAVPIKILDREKYDRKNVTLELVPLRSEKHFRTRPQNRILVFFRGSLQNFRRAPSWPRPFIIWKSPAANHVLVSNHARFSLSRAQKRNDLFIINDDYCNGKKINLVFFVSCAVDQAPERLPWYRLGWRS